MWINTDCGIDNKAEFPKDVVQAVKTNLTEKEEVLPLDESGVRMPVICIQQDHFLAKIYQ